MESQAVGSDPSRPLFSQRDVCGNWHTQILYPLARSPDRRKPRSHTPGQESGHRSVGINATSSVSKGCSSHLNDLSSLTSCSVSSGPVLQLGLRGHARDRRSRAHHGKGDHGTRSLSANSRGFTFHTPSRIFPSRSMENKGREMRRSPRSISAPSRRVNFDETPPNHCHRARSFDREMTSRHGPCLRSGDGRSSHRHRSLSRRDPLRASPDASTTGAAATPNNYSTKFSSPPASHFLIRVGGCQQVFPKPLPQGSKPKRVYFILETSKECRRTSIAEGVDDFIFDTNFVFTSCDPDREILSLKLLTRRTTVHSNIVDQKISKAMVSLQNLRRGEPRDFSLPLVRHAGTSRAYECGQVQLQIFSHDYGTHLIAPKQKLSGYYAKVHDLLARHAPERLHFLDCYVAQALLDGPRVLKAIENKCITTPQSSKYARLHLTVHGVSDLTTLDGGLTQTATCWLSLSVGKCTRLSKVAHYHRRAVFEETFVFDVTGMRKDGLRVAVVSAARKLCEAELGLANIRDGVPKVVTLMLVCGATTEAAAYGGQIHLTLRTQNYTSPCLMSAVQEAQLRQRVLGYVWSCMRADLHRLDAIVECVRDVKQHKEEWLRLYGPEPLAKRFSISVRRCWNIFPASASPLGDADIGFGPRRLYVRLCVGPLTRRTDISLDLNGVVTFIVTFQLASYTPQRDVVRVLLVEEMGDYDREVSRVEFALASLYRQVPALRRLRLVAEAGTSLAHSEGEVEIELTAHDFGAMTGQSSPGRDYSLEFDQFESAIRHHAPQYLHRVPYLLDTFSFEQQKKFISKAFLHRHATTTPGAPLCVRTMGIRNYQLHCDCYVKVYLNDDVILRTRAHKATSNFVFDIDDDNEVTRTLAYTNRALLSFEVKQPRMLGRDRTLAWAELALRLMDCEGPHKVWLPLFGVGAGSKPSSAPHGRTTHRNIKPFALDAVPKLARRASAVPELPTCTCCTNVIGYLGVMVQSMALPPPLTPESHGQVRVASNVTFTSAVLHDVRTLLAKYNPKILPRAQAFIAQCISTKEAHLELRSKLCAKPLALTVYLQIEKVELSSAEGRAQEEEGEIMVQASFTEMHQGARRCFSETKRGLARHPSSYSSIRLDITRQESYAGVAETKGPRGDAKLSVPPLELTLISLTTAKRASTGATLKLHRWRVRSVSSPSFSRIAADTAQERSSTSPARPFTAESCRSFLRAVQTPLPPAFIAPNHHLLVHSREPISILNSRPLSSASRRSVACSASPIVGPVPHKMEFTSLLNHDHTCYFSSSSSRNGLSPASAVELGRIRLSLRALLSSPFYQIGDFLRVPVVASSSEKVPDTPHARRGKSKGCVVGHITFRVALPMLEVVPEWMRLRGADELKRTSLARIRDYERRIVAYLQMYLPMELVDFHYRLYESDRGPRYWQTSLYHHLQSLQKCFGPQPRSDSGSPT